MLEGRVKIVNPLGLHARAAAQLVRTAGMFKSRITLKRLNGDESVDAKSILSLLTLAASSGTELMINVDGEDEAEASRAIIDLFASGFGEV